MSLECTLKVDNKKIKAKEDESLLFTLFQNNIFALGKAGDRKRGAYCGMGVCQECLVKINNSEKLACQTLVYKDMEITTNE